MRYVTNSELSTLRQCKRKHWFGHVLKIGKATEDYGVAHTGTITHAVLEAYYAGEALDGVLARFTKQLADVEDSRARASMEAALILVEGFADWLAEEGADQRYTVAGVEREHSREIPGFPGWAALAKMDLELTDRETGEHVISDHKSTGLGIDTFMETFRRKTQPVHYAWVLGGAHRFLVTVLRRSKRTVNSTPPFYARKMYPVTSGRVESYGEYLGEWVTEIQAQEQLSGPPAPSPGDACGWCPFVRVCQAVDNREDWRGLVEAEFVAIDPIARYNDFDLD